VQHFSAYQWRPTHIIDWGADNRLGLVTRLNFERDQQALKAKLAPIYPPNNAQCLYRSTQYAINMTYLSDMCYEKYGPSGGSSVGLDRVSDGISEVSKELIKNPSL
jgi:hypothetical protein